jgi:beta-phosphoglucomutase-like phosphatase (HAD superfamily)
MLTLTGLVGYFGDYIFSAADLGKPKPAPDIYLHVADQMRVRPDACLVIEDTPIGVSAAVAAGMTVYGYSALTPKKSLLSAGAYQTFDSMFDLATFIH